MTSGSIPPRRPVSIILAAVISLSSSARYSAIGSAPKGLIFAPTS